MPKRKQPPKPSKSEAVVQQPQETEIVAAEGLPPALTRALQAVRAAVGAVLDLADATAEAVTKGLQARQ